MATAKKLPSGSWRCRVYDYTQEDIQRHVNAFTEGHSPKSVRDNHALISAVLRETRPDFALNTVLPQKIRPQLYVPTDDDIKKVMEAAKGTEMEIPILLAAFGPMRRGEICALDRSDIAGTRVHVHRNMVLDENRKYIIKSPKSYAGDRFIPTVILTRCSILCKHVIFRVILLFILIF